MQHPRESERLAPFIVHREVDIAALLDVVWDLQVHVNEWPSWQPAIETATLAETLAVGAQFRWTGWDLTTTATVDALTTHHRLVWRALDGGVVGVHEWTFEQSPTGTHVTVTELMEPTVQGDVDAHGLAHTDEFLSLWLANLKAEAEART